MIFVSIENEFQFGKRYINSISSAVATSYFLAWTAGVFGLRVYQKNGWLEKKHAIYFAAIMYVLAVMLVMSFGVLFEGLLSEKANDSSIITLLSTAALSSFSGLLYFTKILAFLHGAVISVLAGWGFWLLAIQDNDELNNNCQKLDL